MASGILISNYFSQDNPKTYALLFDIRSNANGLDPALSETGGQPEVWLPEMGLVGSDAIEPLVEIGHGLYYAVLKNTYIIENTNKEDSIVGTYKSVNTIQTTSQIMTVVQNDDVDLHQELYYSNSLLGASTSSYGTIGTAGYSLRVNYYAEINLTIDNPNTDEYTVIWHRNGTPVTSAISSPTIQVIRRSDGSNLINSTSMSSIGATTMYKYDATGSQRIDQGEAVIVVVGATIDGSSRTFRKVISRDKKS